VPVHVPAPADAAAWLDADTHELLAKEVPGAVKMAVKSKLLALMQQWLAAYDAAQVCGWVCASVECSKTADATVTQDAVAGTTGCHTCAWLAGVFLFADVLSCWPPCSSGLRCCRHSLAAWRVMICRHVLK
jgi:hypothetical protein